MKARASAALGALLVSFAPPLHAELPPAGERIRTHDYGIDLSQTPVLAGTRVTGLGGAYVALAEGIDGVAQNPGAIALRTPWSTDHFDFDLGVGITFSSALARSDVFNSGRRTLAAPTGEEALTFLNLAATFRIGRWGFGFSSDLQSYSLDRSKHGSTTGNEQLLARFAITHSTIGYGFADNQWLVGFGVRGSALDVVNTVTEEERSLFSAAGVGVEAGLLYRPTDAPFRIGVCARSPVTATASPSSKSIVYEGDSEKELYLPNTVALPWELNVGVALQLGKRPLNPRLLDATEEFMPLERYSAWRERERNRARREARAEAERRGRDPNAAEAALAAELDTQAALDGIWLERERKELQRRLRERAAGMPRSHFLLSLSLDVLGPVESAVGVESFLERTVQRSGRRASFSPRAGLETEAVRGWTRLRVGSYIEPSRFDDSNGARTHFTVGLDQRLFRWEVFGLWAEGSTWMLAASLDVAREYLSTGIAVGMWH